MVTVSIGRASGPNTDVEVASDFHPEQVELILDIVAMVNKASGNHERWYVIVGDQPSTVPVIR